MTTEARVTALEDRVTTIENSYGDKIYKMDRRLIGVEITVSRLAKHFGVTTATGDDIDAVMEDEI